jgi:hypothetical protein
MTQRTRPQLTLLHGARTLCATLTLVAGVGVAPLLLAGPVVAQSDRSEAARNTADATFPTEQRMEEGLRFAVAQGELDQEQADMMMRVFKRLSMGLESGRLTVSEAMGIMEQRARAISAQQPTKTTADSSDSSLMIIQITAALEAGDITPAQGAEYILIMQRSVAAEDSYAEFESKIVAAVRSGEMTREDAGQKIEAFKKELHEQMLSKFKERMIAAIEDGTMTETEVDDVWAAYKKMNFEDDEPQFTRQDYAEAQAKMQKMVDAGEITRAQMKTRLGEMRSMIGKGTSKTKTRTGITRQDYAEAQAKMKKMIDAGEITRAQMKTRLGEMRSMIGKGTSKTETRAEVTRQDYAEAQASMQKMVDAGEMTEEQMNGRLNRMRKMMGRPGGDARAEDRSRDDVSADCMELRRKLGDAVRAGEMTREEAGEVWRNEGC